MGCVSTWNVWKRVGVHVQSAAAAAPAALLYLPWIAQLSLLLCAREPCFAAWEEARPMAARGPLQLYHLYAWATRSRT